MFVMHSIRFPACLSVLLCLDDPVGMSCPHIIWFRRQCLPLPPPPPPPLVLSTLRRSLSPYKAGAGQSVTYAMQVDMQDEKSEASYRSPTKGVLGTVRAGHWTAPMVMQEDGDHLQWWRWR